MKNSSIFAKVFFVVAGLALGPLSARAQNATNFWWTNWASAFGYNWTNTATGDSDWTNNNVGATGAPQLGGSNEYTLTFGYLGNVALFNMTNTQGTTANNGFKLNQLVFSNSPAAALYGSNLVFVTNNGGTVLPTFNQYGASNVTLNVGVVLSNTTTFGGAGTGAVTLNSNVFGPGSLTMGGNYTLTLNASNSYGGGTTITNGTVKVGNAGAFTNYWAFGTNRTITVSGAGTLDLNNANLATNYNVVISGAGVGGNGAIVNSGTGMTAGFTNLTLAGNATVGGAQRWDVRNFAGTGLVNLNGYTLTKVSSNTVSLVGDLITDGSARFDAILLDVDNGPAGLMRAANDDLYDPYGLRQANAALTPKGILAVWSAAPEPAFTRRLQAAGFHVEDHRVRANGRNTGPRHVVWLATKTG